MADVDTVTISELDVADVTQDGDKLIIEAADGKVKSVSKKNLLNEETTLRTTADTLLQGQITALAGESGVAEKINLSLKGAPNGVAELDEDGKVPSSQLPSYVDDVIEGYYNKVNDKFYEHFDGTTTTYDIWTDGTNFLAADTSVSVEPSGTAGGATVIGVSRIYDNAGTNVFYKLDGNDWYEITAFTTTGFTLSATAESDSTIIAALENARNISISYIQYSETTGTYSDEITPETGKVYVDLSTNLTYRWSGSIYVSIASDLALGETSSTAYRGDRGKIAYEHSQVRGTGIETTSNPHALSKADIGLGNVPNVSTNNQTPTFTAAASNEELESGETVSTLFGKLKKIVKSFIDHIANVSNPHSVTKAQVGLGNVENYGRSTTVQSADANYITGGAVYTEISALDDAKQPIITGAASTITDNDLTPNRMLIADANGKVAVSSAIACADGTICASTIYATTYCNVGFATCACCVLSDIDTASDVDFPVLFSCTGSPFMGIPKKNGSLSFNPSLNRLTVCNLCVTGTSDISGFTVSVSDTTANCEYTIPLYLGDVFYKDTCNYLRYNPAAQTLLVSATNTTWSNSNMFLSTLSGIQITNNSQCPFGVANYGVSIGQGQYACIAAVAIGLNSYACDYSVSVGHDSKSFGPYSVAIGTIAHTSGDGATAVGDSAGACCGSATAIGRYAKALNVNDTALGINACASFGYGVAIGDDAWTLCGVDSVSIGRAARAYSGATAVGAWSCACGTDATAFGSASRALANYSTAIGRLTCATCARATALGYNSLACSTGAVAIGSASCSTASHTIAIGTNSKTSINCGIAIGADTKVISCCGVYGQLALKAGAYRKYVFGWNNGATAASIYCGITLILATSGGSTAWYGWNNTGSTDIRVHCAISGNWSCGVCVYPFGCMDSKRIQVASPNDGNIYYSCTFFANVETYCCTDTTAKCAGYAIIEVIRP